MLPSLIPSALCLFMFSGPLSYYAGTKLSDISLATPEWKTLLILSIIWAAVIPLLQSFSDVWLERSKAQGAD